MPKRRPRRVVPSGRAKQARPREPKRAQGSRKAQAAGQASPSSSEDAGSNKQQHQVESSGASRPASNRASGQIALTRLSPDNRIQARKAGAILRNLNPRELSEPTSPPKGDRIHSHCATRRANKQASLGLSKPRSASPELNKRAVLEARRKASPDEPANGSSRGVRELKRPTRAPQTSEPASQATKRGKYSNQTPFKARKVENPSCNGARSKAQKVDKRACWGSQEFPSR